MLPDTARLTLRALDDGDLPALRAILGDGETMAAYEGAFSEAETLDWLRRQQDRYRADGFGLWAVVERATGDVIGQTGITRQTLEDDEIVEVGYLFRRDRWHRGFAVEAASASVDWAFTTLPVEHVWAKVRDTNLASMNVAIRLGMRVRRRFVTRYRGVDMPHFGFALSRDEWQASRDSEMRRHSENPTA
ncbi:GNAT family N-acetyltransferase [Microbacterium sp. cx-55]|uniref:GNAT family N-acetyltransferase n=1 Tax=Microbacterium sp. cx-55 TaxID=2875948 RepID=UPI001CBE57D0|nr:GNAT family N-acetyltransferase [Microbacterium sp. cx-55]MBZ4486204.1 GNAT family N-acetyltransferase [Microbacterium sp. cx-55]UGB33929.1 GNAT family N-acetyltransferase [Microbacterium sp. cx-55]